MAAKRTPSERLRTRLVKDLRGKGVIASDAVQAAFLAVPRERFIPEVATEHGLEAVYRDEAIVTKRDPRGMPLSSSSQPALMAKMLELLAPRPGDHVLEIGTGTGYNAALLAEMVGSHGCVTSVDVDAGLARTARRALREASYRISVKVGDGREGHQSGAPYDRIIVTACADEIPNAWLEQLADGGRIELPLRVDPDGAAIQVIPVLEREGDRLRSTALTWGGFMPLHSGDGGWRPLPATLAANRSVRGRHATLVSLSGAGLDQLPTPVARELLAAALTDKSPPRRRLTDRHSHSLGVVSLRSPWSGDIDRPDGRVRWRLNAYGGDDAADQLDQLISEWQQLHREHQTKLQINAGGHTDELRLGFAWTND